LVKKNFPLKINASFRLKLKKFHEYSDFGRMTLFSNKDEDVKNFNNLRLFWKQNHIK